MNDAGSCPETPFSIRPAAREESGEIARIVRESFQTVADEIGHDIDPLHETAESVAETFEGPDVALVAELPCGELIGAVRGQTLPHGSVMVSRLAVLPRYRRAGVARALMEALEASYPLATCLELFTGRDAAGPIGLYQSLGYELVESPPETPDFLVWMQKCR
jgi:ribosomal protein S18 acetylase RimI-like enzyme